MTNDELRRLAEAAKPQCDYHPNMTYEAVERVPEDGDCVEAVILFDDNDYAARLYGHMAYDVDGMALAKYWAAASPDAVLELLDENDRLRELLNLCENCQNPIAARSSAEIIDRSRIEIERLRETLTEIRDLARTGLAPTALNMTEDQWDRHRLNRIAREADVALKKQRGER
jgi:hypothetical protein